MYFLYSQNEIIEVKKIEKRINNALFWGKKESVPLWNWPKGKLVKAVQLGGLKDGLSGERLYVTNCKHCAEYSSGQTVSVVLLG